MHLRLKIFWQNSKGSLSGSRTRDLRTQSEKTCLGNCFNLFLSWLIWCYNTCSVLCCVVTSPALLINKVNRVTLIKQFWLSTNRRHSMWIVYWRCVIQSSDADIFRQRDNSLSLVLTFWTLLRQIRKPTKHGPKDCKNIFLIWCSNTIARGKSAKAISCNSVN